jgi:hypothetical protein
VNVLNGRKALQLSQIYPRWHKRDAGGVAVLMPLVGQVPLGTPLADGGLLAPSFTPCPAHKRDAMPQLAAMHEQVMSMIAVEDIRAARLYHQALAGVCKKIAALSMKDRPVLPVESADASGESGGDDASEDASRAVDVMTADDAADDAVALQDFLADIASLESVEPACELQMRWSLVSCTASCAGVVR